MGNAKDFRVSEKVGEAGLILGALGVIGFIGIIWLLIFGNLSGNLGFSQTTTNVINETFTLVDTGNIPTNASGLANPSLANVAMSNASNNNATFPALSSGNFTVVASTVFATATSEYNGTVVNITYDVSFDAGGLQDTENVISNISGGFSTFFTFSNTFFTIAAIVLLIFMFLGLLAIVVLIMRMQQSKGSGFSE